MMSFRAVLVVALMLALNFASAETPPTVDPDSLRRSLDMLKLQMKLRVLQVHYERAGFYYPPEWPQRIQKEYQDLSEAVEAASRQQIAGMDDWLEQQDKARKNEVL
ncbi:MAG TPA: hypothetical protein VK968_13410, partial [Roseimicrobium sp.]|nr:hypothetical protein [Roseimicrobium sp.]